MNRKIDSEYLEIVNENKINAYDYDEQITDFIDENYNTTYNNCNMNDEIEDLFNKMLKLSPHEEKEAFECVEKVYDIACEKYPKIKNIPQLNPRFRHVNSFYVFDDPFNIFINSGEEHCEKLKEELINKYPKCKDLINYEFDYDGENDNEHDLKWFIPLNEILDEQYEQLYYEGMNYDY